MNLRIRLYPPLNNTAGRDRLELSLGEKATIQALIDELVARFGPEFRRHLYDDRDRFIPAWCAFINNRAVHLNQPEALKTPLNDGDEVSFILALAGG
jgi:molybdopterin converting factor small subunit